MSKAAFGADLLPKWASKEWWKVLDYPEICCAQAGSGHELGGGVLQVTVWTTEQAPDPSRSHFLHPYNGDNNLLPRVVRIW